LADLLATYELVLRRGDDLRAARVRAQWIAYEQTVELPPGVSPPRIEREFVARVEELALDGPRRARLRLAFAPRLVDSPSQLLNVLFGNVSMQAGIRLVELEWPAELLRRLGGPRFGVAGLRTLCGAGRHRALSCAALKPVGLDARELARRAFALAKGGIDCLKDDQGIADQPMAPFRDRVRRCQEAVERANAKGRSAVYLPHVSGAGERFAERLAAAKAAGCRGVMVSPLLAGLDAVSAARDAGFAVFAHPALSGALLGRQHGIAARLLWGDVFRAAGADGVIYPNAGGRFPIALSECLAVAEHLRRPLGKLRPAMPVIGGGVEVGRVPEWLRRYGHDLVVLIGGGLYREPELEPAAARLREALERL
jgi:ribulose-bisphosphate carboxylase large chain